MQTKPAYQMNAFFRSLIIIFFTINLQAQKRDLVFLVGERFNSTTQTMPALAVSLEDKFKFRSSYITVPKNGKADDLAILKKADLLILYIHLRNIPDEQQKQINAYINSGRPVIAFRSTNQAFETNQKWFAHYFGGEIRGYTKGNQSLVTVNPLRLNHPILKDVPSLSFKTDSSITIPGPLGKKTVALLMGKTGHSPAFPVAWTNELNKRQRIFYTSLGRSKDFKNQVFIKIVENAVHWCLKLNRESDEKVIEEDIPAPPEPTIPKGANILFNGKDLRHWRHWDLLQNPVSIHLPDELRKFTSNIRSANPNWSVKNGILVCNPHKGDIITKKSFTNYTLNLDFYIPEEPSGIPTEFRGSGGVFLSGRYEIKIKPGLTDSVTGPASIYTLRKPDHIVEIAPGRWHNMKIRYRHMSDAPPQIYVSVNEKSLHSNIKPSRHTPYGIIAGVNKQNPDDRSLYTADKDVTGKVLKMGNNNFSVSARFKTAGSKGTVLARTSAVTGWEKDGKAFFIGNGKLYYDIGWKGIIYTTKKINDDQWHHAVLTHDKDMCIMYLDGKVSFMKKAFMRPDVDGHVFKIGYSFKNFYSPFPGEISNVRYYNRPLTYEEAVSLTTDKKVPARPSFEWKQTEQPRPIVNKSKAEPLKGPIRLHADFSRIRYANIWIKEN